jgi:hypothetical protein
MNCSGAYLILSASRRIVLCVLICRVGWILCHPSLFDLLLLLRDMQTSFLAGSRVAGILDSVKAAAAMLADLLQ